jgi:predicted nuclease with TOPRIM domain
VDEDLNLAIPEAVLMELQKWAGRSMDIIKRLREVEAEAKRYQQELAKITDDRDALYARLDELEKKIVLMEEFKFGLQD